MMVAASPGPSFNRRSIFVRAAGLVKGHPVRTSTQHPQQDFRAPVPSACSENAGPRSDQVASRVGAR